MSESGMIGSASGAVSEAVARAEARLAQFWAAPTGEGGKASMKVRASTLNYVIVCGQDEADAYREATERLSETHGGRTLLLTMSGRIAAWDLLSEIHAVCRIDGSTPVCYDRVDLTFGAVSASRAGSVVRSLALAELPTIVEIGADAPQPLVDAVSGKCDRLIVDSAKSSPSSIKKALDRSSCPVADRAMIRAYSWRELTARFFDDAVEALPSISRVEIARTKPLPLAPGQITGGEQDPAPVFLGWLGSRLGWTFASRGRARSAGGGSIEIALTDDARTDVDPGQLTAVRITSALSGEALHCELSRSTPESARWTMRGAKTAEREHALGHKDETWVAIKAIDAKEGDLVTRAALLAAAEWENAR